MKSTSERGIVSSAGVELGYFREGAGRPIVVIGSATYYPRAFSARLRREYELIFVDSRHFVPSYFPPENEMDAVTFETLADDVEAIRRHLGIDEWILLGHSIHAQIAMAYADKYPARTSRLVLIAGVPFGLVELNSIADRFWNEQASKERQRQHVVNRTAIQNVLSVTRPSRQFVVNYFGDAAKFWADPTYDAAWLWKDVETSPVFERLAGKLPSPSEARSMLQRLQMPTLVMLGKLDYAIPYVAWEQVIDGLQNLDYTLLTEDSHNPQTESPERFDRALIDWLEN